MTTLRLLVFAQLLGVLLAQTDADQASWLADAALSEANAPPICYMQASPCQSCYIPCGSVVVPPGQVNCLLNQPNLVLNFSQAHKDNVTFVFLIQTPTTVCNMRQIRLTGPVKQRYNVTFSTLVSNKTKLNQNSAQLVGTDIYFENLLLLRLNCIKYTKALNQSQVFGINMLNLANVTLYQF